MTHARAAAVSALVGVALAGCGGPVRYPVEGQVSLDGHPLKQGYVQFLPADASAGQPAGCEIHDGRFRLSGREGLFAGRYRVEITSLGLSKDKILDPLGSGRMVQVHENIIPARFNTASKLEAEVVPKGLNAFEYAVASK